MTGREKKLLIFLGVFGVLGLAFGFWMLVVNPILDNRQQALDLQEQYANKRLKLDELEAKAAKLNAFKQKTLPGDRGVADGQYQQMMHALLRGTGMPSASTAVPTTPTTTDLSRMPLVAPKVPAWTRVTCQIVLRKVSIPMMVRFLEAYYKLPVLQQITRFEIKPSTDPGSAAQREARSDLEVTIHTEAISIDGAPKEPPYFPVSKFHAALAGGIGLGLLEQSPELARYLWPNPSPFAKGRDYSQLIYKDPFHGPMPEVKIEGPKVVRGPEPPPPTPKEDLSPFIRLTGITWRSDGTVTADIRDAANDFDYEVSRRFSLDGELKTVVKKFFFLKNERKPLDRFEDELVISEEGTLTHRVFKVLDFLPEGLLLSETVSADMKPEEPKKEDTKSPGKFNIGGKTVYTPGKSGKTASPKPSSPAAPKASPLAAFVGSAALVPPKPGETRWLWPVGAPLSKLEKLPGQDASKESTPMPRENPQGK